MGTVLGTPEITIVTSKITDHRSVTMTDIMRKFIILGELPECDRHRVSRCCWRNGADGLAQCRVVTNLQLLKKKKNPLSVKCNEMRSTYIGKKK